MLNGLKTSWKAANNLETADVRVDLRERRELPPLVRVHKRGDERPKVRRRIFFVARRLCAARR